VKEGIVDDKIKATIWRYLTGAGVAALGGALGALTTLLDGGTIPSFKVLGLAVAAGAVMSLRLWLTKEKAGFLSIVGVEKSLGDKLAATPDETWEEGGILYKALLPAIGPSQYRAAVAGIEAPPDLVEVRKFSDQRLQDAIEHVFDTSGGKNGMFFNVNLNGEIRAGVAVKIGGHLSIGGFLEKKPGLKLEGLAEVTYTF
jgi:hypothetical protein